VSSSKDLLTVENLRVSIRTDEGTARILDGVNLNVPRGKVVGVAGESGCGKSTLAKAILGILPEQSRIESGRIVFDGQDLTKLSDSDMQSQVRGRLIGFVPQDPYLALNPVFTVGAQLLEVLRAHGMRGDEGAAVHPRRAAVRRRARIVELLRAVQLPDPDGALERYPHEFSGGQRQRLLIAAALACQPKLILADEPTTALDVTTQQQILGLMKRLADELHVSMLFISHDFGVISELCDRVSVMYAGQTAETGETRHIIDEPLHPYTRMLLSCHPDRAHDLEGIPGQVPSALHPPGGCHFHPRCPSALDRCSHSAPPATRPLNGMHEVACWLHSSNEAVS
jgi:oligopeptide/dipeptide ABC transporter ATP-binding protein